MSKVRVDHIGEEDLIRYSDGELSSQEAAQVQEHLEACWRCRTSFADVQQTITEYVGLLDAANRSIPDPPQPWGGFLGKLEQLAEQRRTSWWRRTGSTLGSFF